MLVWSPNEQFEGHAQLPRRLRSPGLAPRDRGADRSIAMIERSIATRAAVEIRGVGRVRGMQSTGS